MAIFSLLALVFLVLYLGTKWEEKIVDVLPVVTSGLLVVLYILAFFRGLSWIDWISLGVIVCLAGALEVRRRNIYTNFCSPKSVVQYAQRECVAPATVIALLFLVLVTLGVMSKKVTWWDDYNFWATDVKSLFYLNGFADKYTNVASEFGDYPPMTQLMKWFFMHFYPVRFQEGLMFAGYYCMSFVYAFPLLRYIKKHNVLLMLLVLAGLWIAPSALEVFYLDGCCADFCMALIFGAYLCAVMDRTQHSSSFYYARLALYLAVLMLVKSTAIIWVLFALVFTLVWWIAEGRQVQKTDNSKAQGLDKKQSGKQLTKAWLLLALCPACMEASWYGFCLVNRRVSKLLGTTVSMAVGKTAIPAYRGDLVRTYMTAFAGYPLHRWNTVMIDLSPLAFLLLLEAAFFILMRVDRDRKSKYRFLMIFSIAAAAVFYSFNLIVHLTVFAQEDQYREAFAMVSSIERYGAPITIGMMYVLCYMLLTWQGRMGVSLKYVLCLVPILLCADYNSAYRGIYAYRDQVERIESERADILDADSILFLDTLTKQMGNRCARVLYLRDVDDLSWIRNTYLNFDAAPISLMHGVLGPDEVSVEKICQMADEAHAGYVWIGPLQNECEGEKMQTIYRVEKGAQNAQLVPAF